MSIAEETLMAYVDGELDPEARAQVEAAMRDDPDLSERVAKHRELRAKIQLAYAPELTEAVPERLLAAARQPIRAADSNIVDLKEARAALQAPPRAEARNPSWRFAASMAASLVIGVGVGLFATGAVGLMAGVSEGVGLGRADGWDAWGVAGSAGPVIRPRIRSTWSWASPAKMLGLMSSPHPWMRSSNS